MKRTKQLVNPKYVKTPAVGKVYKPFKIIEALNTYYDSETGAPEQYCLVQCGKCGSYRITLESALESTLNPICQCCRLENGARVPYSKDGDTEILGRAYKGISPMLLSRRNGFYRLIPENAPN